ncbi:MAG: DUF58 domain-containing protein, partial [Myxococcota bacterium]|nr:DUF58 domain-containing protein [Myxococcota bacterium]
REFENEVAVSAYLMLDISTSMRGASDRPDKLEHAIELCMAMARSLSKGSDRFGLISFDERVYGHVAAAEGGRQSHRVGQHLLGLHQLVDEESSDFDDDEVVEHLVRYLMLQHRLDFRHMNPRRRSADHEEGIEDRINVVLLNRWLNQQLKQSPKELLASLQVGVVRPEQSFARRYCQLHGIELPYRSEARYGGKDNGLLAALECALTNARQPSLFLIVSDLNGLLDYARCARAMQLAKSKHHRVLILAPYTPSYFEEASTEQASKSVELQTQRVLHGLFSEVERREREKALRVLSKAGIPVLDMRRSDGVEALLQRISTGRA